MDALHKIVSWVTSPLGMLFLGLLVAIALAARRSRKLALAVFLLSVGQLWFFSTRLATRLVGVPLEMEECSEDDFPPADAIVLLGGGVGLHEACGRAEIFSAADRAWMAARLWKRRPTLLTVSGGGAPGELQLLAEMGVPTNEVLNLSQAKNTEDEARLIAEAIAAGHASFETRRKSILLVSSAWHLPRARVLFERAGFDVTPAPTDFEMQFAAESPFGAADFVPNADALLRNSYAVKEWFARLCYAVKR